MTQCPQTVVLLVEDEPLILMSTAQLLEDEGFRVIEATDAEEALTAVEANSDISVLFTDINMPGEMDGLDLARQVHIAHPDIHLILTSGKVSPTKGQLPDDGCFIGKPYSVAAVARVISSMLHVGP